MVRLATVPTDAYRFDLGWVVGGVGGVGGVCWGGVGGGGGGAGGWGKVGSSASRPRGCDALIVYY